MSQVTITLPDGSSRSVPAGTPVRDVAEGISPRLAKAALAGVVDGKLVDLDLSRSSATRRSASSPTRARKRWRCTGTAPAHLLAAAVTNLFPGVQCGIGPATDEGFFYDFVVAASVRAGGSRGDRAEDEGARVAGSRLRAADVAARGGEGVLREARRAAEGAADRREDRRPAGGVLLHDQGQGHLRRLLRRPARADAPAS